MQPPVCSLSLGVNFGLAEKSVSTGTVGMHPLMACDVTQYHQANDTKRCVV